MQPTIPQSTGGSDMDLPAVQPMDWLFKKERIYLLAQFWQQGALFGCVLSAIFRRMRDSLPGVAYPYAAAVR
uniref:Uncharacterized protein n=1 Tax=Anopheles epiroticus TaxID=199890 RepID=A0A182PJ37_9DIPT